MVDVVLLGVEKEYKRDDDEDDNHDKEIIVRVRRSLSVLSLAIRAAS